MIRSVFYKILVFLILSIFSFQLQSQIIYVKEGGVGGGTSWGDATGDLRAAILGAASGEEVWVAEGTYYPGAAQGDEFRLKNGVTVYGGFPDVGNPNMGDRNPTVNITTMSGDIDGDGLDADNTYHVVYASGTINNTAILDGFTITGGYADSENDGGGIYLRNAHPNIRNCIIEGNRANDNGGGVYLENCDGNFIFCTIRNNFTVDDGGGVHMRSGSDVTFTNCLIELNTCDEEGAGVYIDGGSPTFSATSIDNNTITGAGRDGGGVYMTNNSTASYSGGSISTNTATDEGGGVFVNNGSASFNSVDINNNTSTDRGGGIYVNGGSPSFTNSNINSNTVTDNNEHGGGMFVRGSSAPTVTGCTFNGNSCTYNGGAIYSESNAWTVAIDGNTFINNTATGTGGDSRGRGGAIYIQSSAPPITNNTFTSNTATMTTVNRYSGGGAICINGQSPQIIGNTFTGNTASTSSSGTDCGRGGAVYLVSSSSTLTNNTFNNNNGHLGGAFATANCTGFTMTNCTFSGNSVTAYRDNTGWGGAVYTNGGGVSIISQCTFTGGDADPGLYASSGRGGAVCIDNGNDVEFYRCSFTGNDAEGGGAFYYDGDADCKITNCLIYGNTAVNGGGAYYLNSTPNLDFNNVYADNTATNGGAIYCQNSDPRFENNIFWNNTIYLNDGGSDPYFNYCDVQNGTAGFLGGGAGGYNAGRYTNCIEVDPQFSDAAYHITLVTSPCIGGGNPVTATGDFPADGDYDGEKRVRGTVDIGAYETNNDPVFVELPYPPLTERVLDYDITMSEDEVDAGGAPDPFVLTLDAVDLDDEDLTWSIISLPSNGVASVPANTVAPNPQSNPITYTPNADYNGTDMFRVQISDGTLTDVIQVNVDITPVNDAPYFVTTPAALTVKANQTWTYNISTNDVDHNLNTLTLACSSKPAGMTFIPGANGTGILTWTPGDADVSPPIYPITLRITDPDGDWEEQTFNLSVLTRFINVPADYPTIQQAVNVAVDGEDKIIVASGTYAPFNTNGKTIDIEGDPANPANVIIDGGNSSSCIVIDQGGSPIINGFTLTNGAGQVGLPAPTTFHAPASGYYGGGLLCYNSSPTLTNLIVENNTLIINGNHGGSGAGIYIGQGSVVTITNSVIQNNTSETYRGGGLCIDDSDVTLNNVDILNNYAGDYGGGISLYNTTLDVTNVDVENNSVDGENGRGGGIYDHNSNITGGVGYSGNSASVSGNNIYTFN